MILVSQLKLKPNHSEKDLEAALRKAIYIKDEDLISWEIEKRSIDARKKPDVYYVYTLAVRVRNEKALLDRVHCKKVNPNIRLLERKKYQVSVTGSEKLSNPPVVVGSGPAGLFCAYELAKQGYNPILLERGAAVEERMNDVNTFWETGVLNPESNVQFGEGGAGTFSDGKLNTGVKDPIGRNREILEVLVQHGAPKKILQEAMPHIGTDILVDVVRNIRNRIIELGGDVRFHAKVTELIIENKQIKGVLVNDSETIHSDVVVLALGHSARDTFEQLHKQEIPMEAKAFAVGLRVEHKQEMINESQYGRGYDTNLEPSPYKLTANLGTGRGVYSFCMCPGGYVVNAASEEGGTVVNGMSYSDRGGENANSALVVSVKPDDFQGDNALKGMYFQRELEKKAYDLGQGKVPVQLWKDYMANKETTELGAITPAIKGEYAFGNLQGILPAFVNESLVAAMEVFGRKIKGFNGNDAILTGVETRTSSPIRIPRNDQLECGIKGVYPCGEGAGYAGGITSAAIDGVKVFESIISTYKAN